MAQSAQIYDIAIAGAGPAGLTLAALLAEQGIKVCVIDQAHPADLARKGADTRTTALSFGTVQLLKRLGFWDALAAKAEPILTIDIKDGKAPLLLHFGTDATAAASGTDHATPMGWIVENPDLRECLWQAVDQRKKYCTILCPYKVTGYNVREDDIAITLSGTDTIYARLLVGADGRFSAVRELAGCEVVVLDYNQIATVGLIAHEHPHEGRAIEHFKSEGPFAVLPFTDDAKGQHRSAVVWSRPLTPREKRLVSQRQLGEVVLSQDNLQQSIRAQMDARYGTVTLIGTWDHYPLSLYHSETMIAERVALVGDAAHAIHPIAGQGLNLGMQDIDYLVDLVMVRKQSDGDYGAMDLLEDYQRERRFKVFAMVAATDGLNRLFGITSLPLKIVRTLGLGIVQATPRLKEFFVKKAMGL